MITELMERIKSNCTENEHPLSESQIEDIYFSLVSFANRFEEIEDLCLSVKRYVDNSENQLNLALREKLNDAFEI